MSIHLNQRQYFQEIRDSRNKMMNSWTYENVLCMMSNMREEHVQHFITYSSYWNISLNIHWSNMLENNPREQVNIAKDIKRKHFWGGKGQKMTVCLKSWLPCSRLCWASVVILFLFCASVCGNILDYIRFGVSFKWVTFCDKSDHTLYTFRSIGFSKTNMATPSANALIVWLIMWFIEQTLAVLVLLHSEVYKWMDQGLLNMIKAVSSSNTFFIKK